MSARVFPEVSIGTPAEPLLAHQITCSVCTGVGYFAFKRRIEFRPAHAVITHFRAEGWLVGSSARKDRCPIHRRAIRPEKPDPMTSIPEETIHMTTTLSGTAGKAAPLKTDAPKADAPPVMTRTERRIITAKMEDVYGNDSYQQGWTDKRVAADLGVPVAWVRDVRDQTFGPEGSNPVLDEYLKATREFDREYQAMMEIRKKHLEDGAHLRGRLDTLDSKARDIAGLAKRVEREIGR